MITNVLQQNSKGCGIAVLATLTGRAYDQVLRDLYGSLARVETGLFVQDLQKYLGLYGIHCGGLLYAWHPDGSPRLEWPFVPENSDLVIIGSRVYKDSPCSHYSIMETPPKILDPMFGEVDATRYYSVENILPVKFPSVY